MAKKGYVGIWISLIVAVFAMVGCQFGEDVYDDPQEQSTKATVQQDLGVTCGVLPDCQPYDPCVKNGSVQCINRRCIAVQDTSGAVDLKCVIDINAGLNGVSPSASSTTASGGSASTSTVAVSTGGRVVTTTSVVPVVSSGGSVSVSTSAPSGVCGQVSPPQELITQKSLEEASCYSKFKGATFASTGNVRAWVDVVADQPGSTVQVISLSVYGILPNGKVELAYAGTGQSAVTWAGKYTRNPWFPRDLPNYGKLEDVPLTTGHTYTAFTNPYTLHFGNPGVIVGSYKDFFVAGVFRTTGDAKVMVGADIWWMPEDTYGFEMGNSSWYSCTSGTITVVSYNPTLADPCSNQIGVVSTTSTTTTTTTTSNGCPSTGIKVTPGSSLISSCASDLRLVTWDNAGNTIRSPSDDAPLVTTPNFLGFLAVTSTCGGAYRTSWPSVGSSAVSAGFSQVCSQGQDVTSTSVICNDGNGSKLSIAINPKESTGRCL